MLQFIYSRKEIADITLDTGIWKYIPEYSSIKLVDYYGGG